MSTSYGAAGQQLECPAIGKVTFTNCFNYKHKPKILSHSLELFYVLAAVSKGMQAVKLCTNKILQFLTGGAS